MAEHALVANSLASLLNLIDDPFHLLRINALLHLHFLFRLCASKLSSSWAYSGRQPQHARAELVEAWGPGATRFQEPAASCASQGSTSCKACNGVTPNHEQTTPPPTRGHAHIDTGFWMHNRLTGRKHTSDGANQAYQTVKRVSEAGTREVLQHSRRRKVQIC